MSKPRPLQKLSHSTRSNQPKKIPVHDLFSAAIHNSGCNLPDFGSLLYIPSPVYLRLISGGRQKSWYGLGKEMVRSNPLAERNKKSPPSGLMKGLMI